MILTLYIIIVIAQYGSRAHNNVNEPTARAISHCVYTVYVEYSSVINH